MLNQIIFVLRTSDSGYIQTIAEDIRAVRHRLREQHVAVIDLFVDHIDELDSCIGTVDSDGVRNSDSGTLYVADSMELLGRLLDTGRYAVALLHDYNRREDFSRALYALDEIREIEYDFYLKAYQRMAGLPWHIADTTRLTIRETTVEDVEAFYKIYQDSSITRYMEGLYPEIEEEKVYIQEYIKQIYSFFGYGIWTVLLRETSEIIGRAGISWRDGALYPELGFIIAKDHQRKGYGEEVCREILDFARRELQFDSIQVFVEAENIPSLKLCDKLGFQYQSSVVLKEKTHMLLQKRLSCLF